MNNAWASIALKSPCAARVTHRSPLLHLFNGYKRSQSSRCIEITRRWDNLPSCRRQASNVSISSQTNCDVTPQPRRNFTTTALLSRRVRPAPGRRKDEAQAASDSRLEPAPTVASHTEGLSADAQEEAITWRDYDPAGGMPLPNGDRSQAQINGIFGNEDLDADTGNYILNVMHWRRRSGALIDVGLDFPNDSGVTREQALRGLQYVREIAPELDEQAAGKTWVDEESQRLQNEIQERSIKMGIYKREDLKPGEVEEEEVEEEQGTDYGRERNRESQLQQMRNENKAKYEAEQVEKQAAQEKADAAAVYSARGPLELGGGIQPTLSMQSYTGPDGITISRPQTKAWLQPVKRKSWVKYYEEHAQIIKEHSIPQLSLLRRLGPSLVMLLATFGVAAFVADNYTPPPESARIWPDSSPAVATLSALTIALATSFILSRFPPLWRTFSKYFTLVPAYPYSLSLIGCTFRHDTLAHLVTNASALWLFGLLLHEEIGRRTFLAIYFSSGALGAYTSLAYNVFHKQWMAYMFGCSGAVLGIVAAVCTLKPTGHVKIFGYDLPIGAWMFLALYGASSLGAVRMGITNIDHAGHVGGLIAGFGWGLWLRMNRRVDEGGEMKRVDALNEVVESDVD